MKEDFDYRLFKTTKTNSFFGKNKITPNETGCFDQCYQNILVFLQTEKIPNSLPEKISWSHTKLNPESFIYLDQYEIKPDRNSDWSISGSITEHEPYHIPGYMITNYLSISIKLSWLEKIEFIFAFFDGDVSPSGMQSGEAYYYYKIPEKHRPAFEKAINP